MTPREMAESIKLKGGDKVKLWSFPEGWQVWLFHPGGTRDLLAKKLNGDECRAFLAGVSAGVRLR